MESIFDNVGFAQFFFLFAGILLFILFKLRDFILARKKGFEIGIWLRLNGFQTLISIIAAVVLVLVKSEKRPLSWDECVVIGLACDSAIKALGKPIKK